MVLIWLEAIGSILKIRSKGTIFFGMRFAPVLQIRNKKGVLRKLGLFCIFARMKKRILFVCLGNICRSPAAEGVMRRLIEQRGLQNEIEVDSAGTYGGHAGDLPDIRMRTAARNRGYLLTHRARRIREEDFGRFDRIVVMDDMNYESVHRLAPSLEAANKIYRMTEFCRRHPDRTYVPDPYYEGHEGFELVLDLLEDACEGLLDDLQAADSVWFRNPIRN